MKEKTQNRILEILPGLSLWVTFILAFLLSFIKPLWVIYFIIIYDLYWLIRIFYFIIHLFVSFHNYRKVNKINWFNKIKEKGNWEKYYHLIVLPTYNESYEVLRTALQGINNSDYDSKKLIIVFSRECAERAGKENEKEFHMAMEKLKSEFGNKFYKLLGYIHPLVKENELPGKGANATWAVKKIKKELIDAENIPYENIIVSNFDSDTFVYPQYFSRLTYLWMTQKNPHQHSYQPLALYNNNIWDAPSFARVIANSTTFG